MKKNIWKSCLLTFILVISIGANVFASSETVIEPRWSYITGITGSIRIEKSIATVMAGGRSENQEIAYVGETVILQRSDGNSWKDLKTWEDTSDGPKTQIQETYAVYKGYSYRLSITVRAYAANGTLKETVTVYHNYGEYN